MPVVKNKPETGDEKCSYGSWKKHWEEMANKEFPKFCSAFECNQEAVDGAHVIRLDTVCLDSPPIEEPVYILPLCTTHNRNRSEEPFSTKENMIFVSAKCNH